MKGAGPLAGIRVVDLGQYIAGPLAAMVLADLGADIYRIETPDGPAWRSPANRVLLRNRSTVTVDLKTPSGCDVAWEVIRSADVLVENFRPGVLDRLGVGPRDVLAEVPWLVYCSIPGFRSSDPRASQPGWELTIGALTGAYEGPIDCGAAHPVFTAIPVASNFAALTAVKLVLAALLARQRDGLGQHVEVSLFDAMCEAVGRGLVRTPGPLPHLVDPYGAGTYRCADGRWVQLQTFNPRFLDWLVDLAGVRHWAAEGLVDRERLKTDAAHSARLRERLESLFETRPAAAWEELLAAGGVPIGMVRSWREWIRSAPARDGGLVISTAQGDLQPGPVVSTGPIDARARDGAVDRPGTDGPAFPSAHQRPNTARDDDPPAVLDGIRALDLTHAVAGPTMGRLLAELGADVIKVNEPGIEFPDHPHLNRGKRSILLDLKSREGLTAMSRLIDSSDVLIHNFTPGTDERLGIDYPTLSARHPELVYLSFNAYGTMGPWSGRRGYETQAQAVAGMMARYGGAGPPRRQPFMLDDYASGIAGAIGVMAALFARGRSGRGDRVMTSLAQLATFHQAVFFANAVETVVPEASGQAALAAHDSHRLYRTADGWVAIAGQACDENEVADMTTRACAARLSSRTVAVADVNTAAAFAVDPRLEQLGLVRRRAETVVPAPVGVLGRTPMRVLDLPGPLGSDTNEVLAEIGMAPPELGR